MYKDVLAKLTALQELNDGEISELVGGAAERKLKELVEMSNSFSK